MARNILFKIVWRYQRVIKIDKRRTDNKMPKRTMIKRPSEIITLVSPSVTETQIYYLIRIPNIHKLCQYFQYSNDYLHQLDDNISISVCYYFSEISRHVSRTSYLMNSQWIPWIDKELTFRRIYSNCRDRMKEMKIWQKGDNCSW
jgi:hypothetical protein